MSFLSICIPTYNRARDLKRLLDSIALYGSIYLKSGELEICISDNSSNDETAQVVAEYSGIIKNIKYQRNITNIGFGLNLYKCIDMSSADYCWMMGDDEIVTANGLELVLESAHRKPDIIIGNAVANGKLRRFLNVRGKQDFHINSMEDFAEFLDRCGSTVHLAVFAFISSIILRKSFWLATESSMYEKKHPYTHMIQICRNISETETFLTYIDKAIVEVGISNRNQYNSSAFASFELDVLTIDYILKEIFTKSMVVHRAYSAFVVRSYTNLRVIRVRAESNSEGWERLLPVLDNLGFNKALTRKRAYDFFIVVAFKCTQKIRRWKRLFVEY